MRIRLALPQEAKALSHLCFRSKAHWGYDDAFMAQSRNSLIVGVEQIKAGDVWVAEVEGAVAGVVALAAMPDPALVDLDKLFVEPSRHGAGVGRALMAFAIEEARRRGFKKMVILADRNAAPFYERMGAVYLQDKPSDAIPGNVLPFFEIKL